MSNIRKGKSAKRLPKTDSAIKAIPETAVQERDTFERIEERFKSGVQGALDQAREIGEADVVIGIPFYNETDTVAHVVETAVNGLRQFYPDLKAVIVAAGSPVGGQALEIINNIPQTEGIHRIAFCFDDPLINGKGWSVRAIAEISQILGADHAILEADLRSRERDGVIEGLAPDWVHLLLEPIRMGKADVVISKFNRHYLEFGPNLLIYPLLTSIYNRPIHRLVGGQWAISHWLLRNYLKVPLDLWAGTLSGYGVDGWTAIAAIAGEARIIEANLGIKLHKPSIAKREIVLRQVTKVLFEQIISDRRWLDEMEKTNRAPFLQPLATFGAGKDKLPDPVEVYPDQLIEKFKNGLNDFHSLYQHVLPESACRELDSLAQLEKAEFHFPNTLWIQIVYSFVLAYTFDKEFAKGDLLDSLISLHGGFLASFCLDMERLKAKLCTIVNEDAERLLVLEAIRKFESLGNDFLLQRPGFLVSWSMTSEALKPPVPQITYREFIPGVPLVVPTEIISKNGNVVSANGIYETVFERQKTQFDDFVYGRLKVPRKASSLEISLAVKDFLLKVERKLLPGADVSTIAGIQKLVDNMFHSLPHDDTFSLKPEIVARLLTRHPPLTLLTKLRYASLTELLRAYDPCDVMALASWTEEHEYLEGLWKLIKENLRPEHFGRCQIKALVVSHEDFPALVEMKDTSSLDKISSRIVVASLHKGMGGEFPKLRYMATICKNIIEAEKFGRIWQRFAAEKSEFGQRVIRSIEGHWGREPLSAHSIFEDGILRTVTQRISDMAEKIIRDAADDERRLEMENLKALNNAYHLALTLPDGKFVTCSGWSWASYSFKGGRASPSPLSLHVERNWASREFLLEYYRAIGGTEEAMEETIIELMGEGKESHDLAAILLGTEKGVEKVVPGKALLQEQPRAGMMIHFSGNPVLEPIKEHHWESKYVLNAGVVRLDNKTYMVYRAFGDDEVSRLGMAISSDGFRFTERLDEPIFTPANDLESKGCEDPRLIIMDDRLYMTYTAFDGRVAQIALASIGIDEFKDRRWDTWQRHGMVFPGYTDKDAILFPEQFQGKYAMIHRVDPHIWITFSTHLNCPWPRTENRILAGATAGMMWDGKKIGAGAQPLKTRHGWLLITHGVDFDRVYRLGVMLLDLEDPTKLLYRSPNFVLEPESFCAKGSENMCWVPNVVFTCGALPLRDNPGLLSAQDELLVYFGTNDTVIGVATATIGDLIPSQFR